MFMESDVLSRDRWAPWLTFALGLWLVASTLLLPSSSSSGFQTLIFGILIAANALEALWVPGFRFVNTALALWLVVTGMVFGDATTFRFLSTLGAGTAVVVLSFVPSPPLLVHPHEPAV
jgi:hypothetical protein